jgi:HlyD family secretion protein
VLPIILAVVIAALFGLAKMRPKTPPVVTQTSLQEEAGIPVEVTAVQTRTVTDGLEVTGQLAANSVTNLSTKVAGRVDYVAAREGDNVQRGQLVIQLDASDAREQLRQAEAGLAQANAGMKTAQAKVTQARTAARVGDVQNSSAIAQAKAGVATAEARLQEVRTGARSQERVQAQNAVDIAKANLDKARTDYNRYNSLLQQGAVAQATVDSYKTSLEVAQASYNNALQSLSLVQEGARSEDIRAAEAALRTARETLRSAQANAETSINRQADVRAALAGVATAQAQIASAKAAIGIAKQNVANFKIYAPRTGAVTMRSVEPGQYAQPGTPLLTIVDLSTVYVQANVSETDVSRVETGMKVNVVVDSFPNRVFAGRLESVVASADPSSRIFAAKVSVPNPDKSLKPNMFARARIITGTVPDALVVPKAAVVTKNGKPSVVRVVNGEADVVPVTTGLPSGDDIVVRSPALSQGNKIVVSGQATLEAGDKVTTD